MTASDALQRSLQRNANGRLISAEMRGDDRLLSTADTPPARSRWTMSKKDTDVQEGGRQVTQLTSSQSATITISTDGLQAIGLSSVTTSGAMTEIMQALVQLDRDIARKELLRFNPETDAVGEYRFCPRCLGPIEEPHVALSRVDSATQICPECAVDEAMFRGLVPLDEWPIDMPGDEAE